VNDGRINFIQGNTATFNISSQGNNTIQYGANDSAGNEVINYEYVALDSNSAPSASFTTTTTDLEVGVDASGSSDSDGTISELAWDWTNDGNYEATGQTTSHTYGSEGNYNVKLRITDNDGAVDTQVKTITVSSSTDDGGDGGDDGGGGGGGGTTDTTPPDTTDNWDVSGFLDKTQAAVSLSATDAGVGIDRIEYQINGNGYTSVSGNSASVDIFTEGNNTLEYYAVDNNGNEEQTNTEYVAFKTSTNDGGGDDGSDGGDGSQDTVSLQLDSPQGDIDKNGATEISQTFDTTVEVNNSGTLELEISTEDQTGFTTVDGQAIGINSDQSQQFSETFKVDYSNISDSKQVSEEISYRLEWQGDDGYSLASSVQKFRYINNIGGLGNNATGLFSGVPSGLGVYLLLVLLLGVLALPLLIKVRLND
jgi:PKD repeat protein